MAKYIEIEEQYMEDWVEILAELVVGLNSYLDEYQVKDVMMTYLAENRLTADAANELGDIISHMCVRTKKPMDC